MANGFGQEGIHIYKSVLGRFPANWSANQFVEGDYIWQNNEQTLQY